MNEDKQQQQQQQQRSTPTETLNLVAIGVSFLAMALDRMVLVMVVFTLTLNATYNDTATWIKIAMVLCAVCLVIIKHWSGSLDVWLKRFRLHTTLLVMTSLSSIGLLVCSADKNIGLNAFGLAVAFSFRPTEPAISASIAIAGTSTETLLRTRYKTIVRRVGTAAGVIAALAMIETRSAIVFKLIYGITGCLYAFSAICIGVSMSKAKGDIPYNPLSQASATAAAPSSVVSAPSTVCTDATIDLFLTRLRHSACSSMLFETTLLSAVYWYTGETYSLLALAFIDIMAVVFVACMPNRMKWRETKYGVKIGLCLFSFFAALATCLGVPDLERDPITGVIPFHSGSFAAAFLLLGIPYLAYAYFVDECVTDVCRVITDENCQVDTGTFLNIKQTNFSSLFFNQCVGEFVGFFFYAVLFHFGYRMRLILLTIAITLELYTTFRVSTVRRAYDENNDSHHRISASARSAINALTEATKWDYNGRLSTVSVANPPSTKTTKNETRTVTFSLTDDEVVVSDDDATTVSGAIQVQITKTDNNNNNNETTAEVAAAKPN